MVPHQNLAIKQCGRFSGSQPEVAGNGCARGAVIEKDLLVSWHDEPLLNTF